MNEGEQKRKRRNGKCKCGIEDWGKRTIELVDFEKFLGKESEKSGEEKGLEKNNLRTEKSES